MEPEIILAFSGGDDSTFLLNVIDRFTHKRCHPVFFRTPFISPRTFGRVRSSLEERGGPYTVLEVNLLRVPQIVANRPDRCYHCKRYLFTALQRNFKGRREVRFMEGTNFSEVLDERRPGLSALEELNVETPLRLSGMTEEEMETLRREYHIPRGIDDIGCLATRVPYGVPITEEMIKRIDTAEEYLRQQGFHQVRARFYGSKVKIEVDREELARLARPSERDACRYYLHRHGFSKVIFDEVGYRTGALEKTKK